MVFRVLLTTAVALSLTGLYCVYAAVTRPLMKLPTLSVAAPAGPMSAPPRPVENVRVAETYLPQQEWAANAKYHIKSQKAFIYANQWEPEGGDKRIRLRPFAMVWLLENSKTGREEAVTVVSESASVKFAGSLDLPSPDPGRLVHATLDGRAQVTGPNGLMLDGRTFYFSEAAERLWSDNPVRYEYAGSGGRADIFQMDLIPQLGPPGKDRPHIFGIRNVRLSRNVVMELQLKQQGKVQPLNIKCSGSFDYDVLQQRAVYNENVVAFRQTGPTAIDWIECDRLMLQFSSPDDGQVVHPTPVAGQPEQHQVLHSQLRFHWLQADAAAATPEDTIPPLVKLFSSEEQLEARAATLSYDGEQRQIRLSHPDGVQVLRARNPILNCPEVVLSLGDGDQLKSALCRGTGWLVHRDAKTNTDQFAADWKTHMQYTTDPASGLDQIELQDAASFRRPLEESALGAETIRVWMKPPPSGERGASERLGLTNDLRKVEIQRLEAHQNVVMVSPRLEARGQHLIVWLDPTARPVEQSPLKRTGSGPQADSNGDSPLAAEAGDQPISAQAETIRIRLRSGPAQSPDLADLWAEGRVHLEQLRQQGLKPLHIEADQAHVENYGGSRQIVHLFGKPAHVRDQEMHLEAQAMHLDRADNQFRVDGSGALEFPVASGLDGKTLATPAELKVTWHERMSFDGLLATFRGQARATLDQEQVDGETHAQVNSEIIEVTLSDRVRFDTPRPSARKLELQAITCRDRVQLRSQDYKLRKLVETRTAEVSELRMDRATGQMFAQGPGVMQMWRRGDTPRNGLAPQPTANANLPIQSDPSDWQYTWVEFGGQMTGQIEERHAIFKDRVKMLHGPVRLPNQVLTRDSLPKTGGFMSCDELQVKHLPGKGGSRGLIQLAGNGNAWLEGDSYRVSADQIVYDEVRASYLIRSWGKYNARFWHSVAPGVDEVPSEFQRGEFDPASRNLSVDSVVNAAGSR